MKFPRIQARLSNSAGCTKKFTHPTNPVRVIAKAKLGLYATFWETPTLLLDIERSRYHPDVYSTTDSESMDPFSSSTSESDSSCDTSDDDTLSIKTEIKEEFLGCVQEDFLGFFEHLFNF
jgi:hypothetical protein